MPHIDSSPGKPVNAVSKRLMTKMFLSGCFAVCFFLFSNPLVQALPTKDLFLEENMTLNSQDVLQEGPQWINANFLTGDNSLDSQALSNFLDLRTADSAEESLLNRFHVKNHRSNSGPLPVGSQVYMTLGSNLVVNVTVDESLKDKVVETMNTKSALLTQKLKSDLYTRAVNNMGIVEAQGFGEESGGTVAMETHPDNDTVAQNADTDIPKLSDSDVRPTLLRTMALQEPSLLMTGSDKNDSIKEMILWSDEITWVKGFVFRKMPVPDENDGQADVANIMNTKLDRPIYIYLMQGDKK
jgi:hypothetical protein